MESQDAISSTMGQEDAPVAPPPRPAALMDEEPRRFLDRAPAAMRRPPPTKFGAIDVGTNSVHLVMVEISPEGDFRILGRDKEMIQLGKGGFERHRLTQRAVDDGIAALNRFLKMARLKGVGRVKAVATSAVREAKNGGDFVERVRRELGLDLHVLSVEEEARLIYLAVRRAVSLGEDDQLIVDVGGGSMEVIVGNAHRTDVLFSAKLGGLRLSELFLKSDPPEPGELKAMRRHIQRHLDQLEARVGRRSFDRLIGTSGAFESIATVCAFRRGATELDAPRQLRFSRGELKGLQSELAGRTREQRMRIQGVDPRRVDTLLPVVTTLLGISRLFDVSQFVYCDFALREGIIIDHIAGRRSYFQAQATWPDPRLRSVVLLAERCGYRQAHAEQVRRLADGLFVQLSPLHQLDDRVRELLGHACLLHDVGYLIAHKGHHKHSYYLVRNGGLRGFAEMEIEVVANLARYHRRGLPRRSHYSYQHLDKPGRRAVRRLIPILRLANALDRTHYSVVQDVRCRLESDRVEVEVMSDKDSELEIYMARRVAPLFEREYGVPLVIRAPGEGAVETRHG